MSRRVDPDVNGRRLARAVVWTSAVLAAICYIPALRNGFALDDMIIVADDAPLHAWSTLAAALARPYWYDEGHLYRPLTTLAFGVEWAIGHGRPLVFHFANVLWHGLAAGLVARLALRWWPPTAALAAGAWFAVHPVHAEAVANIVGRSELVCAAALLALVLLAVPATPGQEADGAPDRLSLWLAFVLAACAMASKETGVVAPAIVLVAAVTPVSGNPLTYAQRRGRAWRLALASAAGVCALLAARWLILDSLAGDAPHYAFELAPGWRGTAVALATVPRAASLAIVPQPPRLDYSPPDSAILHPNAALVTLGAVLVGLGLASVVAHMRRPAAWSFAASFAALTYAPVSNLVVRTGVVVADRTLYSPSVSAALAVGAFVAAAWAARRYLIVASVVALTALGAAFAVMAEGAWRDSPTAFAAIRDRSPTSYVGHYMWARLLDMEGDPHNAEREYAAALALTPHHPGLLYMAAGNALRLGDTAGAYALLTRAVTLGPDRARARTALVGLALRRADTTAAASLLRDGLARDSTQRGWRRMLNCLEKRD